MLSSCPEGSPVVVDGVMYYITYHYNAEAGEFGTGNDVALYSSLFSVSMAMTPHNIHDLDATRYYQAYDQLSIHFSQRDPTWNSGNPQFAYYSDTPSVATVDESTGHVTFLHIGACRFQVVATEAGFSPQTFEIQLPVGVEQTEYYVPDGAPGSNYTFDPSQNVLVLYNDDGNPLTTSPSEALKNYYQEYRPGMENANYLGITGIPDTGDAYSFASGADCQSLVSQVMAWLQEYNSLGQDPFEPVTPIRYIVGLCGLPSRVGSAVDSSGASVSDMIYQAALAITHGPGYDGTDRLSLAE